MLPTDVKHFERISRVITTLLVIHWLVYAGTHPYGDGITTIHIMGGIVCWIEIVTPVLPLRSPAQSPSETLDSIHGWKKAKDIYKIFFLNSIQAQEKGYIALLLPIHFHIFKSQRIHDIN